MDFQQLLLSRFLGVDWRKLGEQAAREALRQALLGRWQQAAPRIVKHMSRTTKPAKGQIREIQFLLWKAAVRNGHVADAFRDAHDRQVIEMVEPQIRDGVDMLTLVGLVLQAELAITL